MSYPTHIELYVFSSVSLSHAKPLATRIRVELVNNVIGKEQKDPHSKVIYFILFHATKCNADTFEGTYCTHFLFSNINKRIRMVLIVAIINIIGLIVINGFVEIFTRYLAISFQKKKCYKMAKG